MVFIPSVTTMHNVALLADDVIQAPGEFRGKKVFEMTHFFKKKVKKRFSNLRIKPLKYADRLKGTPYDQS